MPQLISFLYFVNTFTMVFSPHFSFVNHVLQTRWIVQEDQEENLGGTRIYIKDCLGDPKVPC